MTLEQFIEICGPNLYLDIQVAEYGNEARKVVLAPGGQAEIIFGRGKTIEEALNNLLTELKAKNYVQEK